MGTATTKAWSVDRISSQAGRLAIVTGATSGIGFQTALELARKGAELILPARSLQKGEFAARRIQDAVPDAVVFPTLLDLSSQVSVRAFIKWYAERFLEKSLGLLINNAGVMAIPKRELTEDGFERQFATNFLGPFALTALMFPFFSTMGDSRIVMLSSSAARWAKIDMQNLQSERHYAPLQAYAQSKLADLVFAIELERRLTAVGSRISISAAHPGYATTNLQTSGPGKDFSLLKLFLQLLKPLAAQNAEQGALPTLFAACDSDAKRGGYYGPDGLFETKGNPVAVKVPKHAEDRDIARSLWQEAERLTQVRLSIA